MYHVVFLEGLFFAVDLGVFLALVCEVVDGGALDGVSVVSRGEDAVLQFGHEHGVYVGRDPGECSSLLDAVYLELDGVGFPPSVEVCCVSLDYGVIPGWGVGFPDLLLYEAFFLLDAWVLFLVPLVVYR